MITLKKPTKKELKALAKKVASYKFETKEKMKAAVEKLKERAKGRENDAK